MLLSDEAISLWDGPELQVLFSPFENRLLLFIELSVFYALMFIKMALVNKIPFSGPIITVSFKRAGLAF